jgi:hypothetical protein
MTPVPIVAPSFCAALGLLPGIWPPCPFDVPIGRLLSEIVALCESALADADVALSEADVSDTDADGSALCELLIVGVIVIDAVSVLVAGYDRVGEPTRDIGTTDAEGTITDEAENARDRANVPDTEQRQFVPPRPKFAHRPIRS